MNTKFFTPWLDVFILIAIGGFFLFYFEPHFLFSQTITTGGDTASHYFSALYLRNFLLPQGKIIGWAPGSFAGFPLFIFYFPLPFLVMVVLSYLIPLQIAFKIGTVIGIFLLPVCTYLALRFMKYVFPMPILGALCTLPFLFMEANSTWGGNIFSTLAGEFTYSLGFAFTILFIGSLYQGISTYQYAIRNGILVALIGLCHGYTLLFSGFASLFFLITTQDFLRKLKYLAKIHSLGFLLMGLWILPLLWNLPYDTRYNVIGYVRSISEVFPSILLPLAVGAILGRLIQIIWALWKDKGGLKFQSWVRLWHGSDPRIRYLWFCVLLGCFLYHIAYQIQVVDIRFLPFVQVLICILAGIELGKIASQLGRFSWIIPVLLMVGVFGWVDYNKKNIHNWIRWNYTGFEGKPLWPVFVQINEALRGTLRDPRVVYEFSYKHNDNFGTLKAFESLPLFSGRSTLEGINFQSSVSAPFIYYIESEISKETYCPFFDYSCTSVNLKNAIQHLKMFNVRDFIVFSEEVKREISKYPEFRLQYQFPPYEIYQLTTNENRYVTPLQFEPVVYQTDSWKRLSYNWFRKSDLNDVHLVFLENLKAQDRERFKTVRSGEDLSNLSRIPIEGPCQVEEDIQEEEIVIKTSCIGRPLLIKISYHPNWKVTGADQIYLASPSFMLIYPNREVVKLTFSKSGADYFGILLSGIGFLILGLHVPWFKASRIKIIFDEAVRRLREWVRSMVLGKKLPSKERMQIFLWGGVAISLLVVGVASQLDTRALYIKGIDHFIGKQYGPARAVFNKLKTEALAPEIGLTAGFYVALTYYLEGDYPQAIREFEKLRDEYEGHARIPEAIYHIGLSYLYSGNLEKGRAVLESISEKYPASPWVGFARERLKENKGVVPK